MKVLRWLSLLCAVACGGDDGGEADAAPACVLPATTITCTVGDDAPCTAVCGAAYCYSFGAGGGGGGTAQTVCTSGCTTVDDCPSGWTCNNMGRCRPP